MVYTDSVANARFYKRFSLLGRLRVFLLKTAGRQCQLAFTVAEIAVMILFSDLLSTEKRESFMVISNVSCEW